MNEVRRLIEVEELSTYGVAEYLGCNQSHIVRLIAKFNKENPNNIIKKRNKSEAQKNFLKSGNHQRVGTTHSWESKEKISDTMRAVYDSPRGDEIREKIAHQREEEWASMSESQKADILQNLKDSNRVQAQSGEGSKFENFIASELKSVGYKVEQRTKMYTPGQKFHVDIALSSEKIIIEIDGPTHWSPIYGDDDLKRVQEKDNSKDAILISNGWNVLRVQDGSGSMSRARFMRVLEQVEFIKDKFNGKPTVHYIRP